MRPTLKIRNWEKFQHYKHRNPPWIKLQTDTFQNYDFACLQDASKLLAICYWTLAARSKTGEVPADFEYVKRQCNLSDLVTVEHLKELISCGFIEDASNVLASCKQNAIPEREGEAYSEERESYPPIVPQRGLAHAKKTSDPDFEDLWKNWQPFEMTKGDKAKALKSYQTARKKKSHDEIARQSEQYQAYCHQSRTKTQHVVTWINERNRNDWAAQEYPEHGLHPTPADLAYKAQHDLTTRMLQDREKYGIF